MVFGSCGWQWFVVVVFGKGVWLSFCVSNFCCLLLLFTCVSTCIVHLCCTLHCALVLPICVAHNVCAQKFSLQRYESNDKTGTESSSSGVSVLSCQSLFFFARPRPSVTARVCRNFHSNDTKVINLRRCRVVSLWCIANV